MKKIIISAMMALIVSLPLIALAEMPGGHMQPGQNTQVGVGVGVDNQVYNGGVDFEQQFITNGPEGVTRSMIGGLISPYTAPLQSTTPHPVGTWRRLYLPPIHVTELYSKEQVEEIIRSNQDIIQVSGDNVRLVVPNHDRQFIYTLPPNIDPVALGLIPLHPTRFEPPANANPSILHLRSYSLLKHLTNSFLMTLECTEDILTKSSGNTGGVSASGSGFMGNVLAGTGVVGQGSVTANRAYRVPICQVTAWSTNVADFDDYLKQLASAPPPEMLYSLYLYKDEAQRKAEFAAAIAKMAEDEAYLKRLREASEVNFVAFYLQERDKATTETQLLAFQQEFSLRLHAKGIPTQGWKTQLVQTDPNAPAHQRVDIAGGVALYYR